MLRLQVKLVVARRSWFHATVAKPKGRRLKIAKGTFDHNSGPHWTLTVFFSLVLFFFQIVCGDYCGIVPNRPKAWKTAVKIAGRELM